MLQNLEIFSRPSYTESVSYRSAPYAMIVYGDRARSSFLSVSLRKRSFTTVPLRPGVFSAKSVFEVFLTLRTHKQSSKQANNLCFLDSSLRERE
jgi:hypothetical protein